MLKMHNIYNDPEWLRIALTERDERLKEEARAALRDKSILECTSIKKELDELTRSVTELTGLSQSLNLLITMRDDDRSKYEDIFKLVEKNRLISTESDFQYVCSDVLYTDYLWVSSVRVVSAIRECVGAALDGRSILVSRLSSISEKIL
jgi:hypothetical protein